MIKTRVNLYSDSLLPAKLRLTFARMMLFVGILVLGSISLYVFWTLQTGTLETSAQHAEAEKEVYAQQIIQLEEQIVARKPDVTLVTSVELAEKRLELKRALTKELSQRTALISRGYSPLLTDLASVSDPKVWLSRITVNSVGQQRLAFEGFGQNPHDIPVWIDRLRTTDTLKGYAFAAMTMDRGDAQPLAFKLTSQPAEEPQ